ncbi:uncharacterized protein N7482_005424 [Penicillium canariense]|uniref:Uncharacterized protein n=1 Tax=Penicillium canariense TaxID=189055 RepID=A0A9W9LNF7_9EURO|nr:uncharacterized protein N7482_005424 [Penicillium canariense]KAJ5166643.1 hypothetical protein N7482_005424 [Penicillium canariense]
MFGQSSKRPRDDDRESAHFAHGPKRLCPPWYPVPDAQPESAADLGQSLRFRAPTLTPADSSEEEEEGTTNGGAAAVYGGSPTTARLAYGPRPPMLHLSVDANTAKQQLAVLAGGDNLSPWHVDSQPGSLQPSPIPHQLVNQSLTINGVPTATPPLGYFPAVATPPANAPLQDQIMMEGAACNREAQAPMDRLPSPVSDNDDAIMGDPGNTGDADTEMGDCPAPSFSQLAPPALAAELANLYQQAPPPITDHYHSSTCNAVPRRRSPLVMGYRAGCNKCQCKAPGHYSHIRRA